MGQGEHQQLERAVLPDRRRRNFLENRVQQRRNVHARLLRIQRGRALQRGGVDDGKVQLVVAGAQVREQVERAVDHVVDLGIGSVNLVDDDDGFVSQAQGFAEHECGLRHGAFLGIHQQQDAVHHAEGAFHLTTEVGMSGRIHDVDLDAFVDHAGVFGLDGDTPLALLVHRVENALTHALDVAVHVGLLQDRVHKGRFPVVHMSDDGDVADVCSAHGHLERLYSNATASEESKLCLPSL